jgi:hypothetical protein
MRAFPGGFDERSDDENQGNEALARAVVFPAGILPLPLFLIARKFLPASRACAAEQCAEPEFFTGSIATNT